MADFFHMSIEEADVSESISNAGSYIKHVHLADNNRLLPGQGHTDFSIGFKSLKRINYKNFMSFESGISGDPEVEIPKSVNFLKDIINK